MEILYLTIQEISVYFYKFFTWLYRKLSVYFYKCFTWPLLEPQKKASLIRSPTSANKDVFSQQQVAASEDVLFPNKNTVYLKFWTCNVSDKQRSNLLIQDFV
jgi:hypothetical protein